MPFVAEQLLTPIHLPKFFHDLSSVKLILVFTLILFGYEGLDKWQRCQASVLEVLGSNPAMTWLKIPSLLSLIALQALT